MGIFTLPLALKRGQVSHCAHPAPPPRRLSCWRAHTRSGEAGSGSTQALCVCVDMETRRGRAGAWQSGDIHSCLGLPPATAQAQREVLSPFRGWSESDFSTAVLLTFGARQFSAVSSLSCTRYRIRQHPWLLPTRRQRHRQPYDDNQKCPPMWPNVGGEGWTVHSENLWAR